MNPDQARHLADLAGDEIQRLHRIMSNPALAAVRAWASDQRTIHADGTTRHDRIAASIYGSVVARIDAEAQLTTASTDQWVTPGERVAAAIPVVLDPPRPETVCTATSPCAACTARLAERGKAHP
jgi:hypothetical protein